MCPFVALYSLPLHCPVPYPAPHSIWLENLLWPFSAVYLVTAPEHLLIFHQPFFQGTLLTILGTIWREHFFNCHNMEVLFSHSSHNYFQFKTPTLEMLETLNKRSQSLPGKRLILIIFKTWNTLTHAITLKKRSRCLPRRRGGNGMKAS